MIRVWAEAALFFFFVRLFQLLGLERASAFGGWLARTVGPLTGYHRRAARRLRRAMPELGDTEIETILKGVWDNQGRTMGEMPFLGAFNTTGPDPRVIVSGREHLDKVLADGTGAIFVSGHFANWEMGAKVLRDYDVPAAVVYRAPNNPIVDRWLTNNRRTHGAPIQIPKGPDGARDLIKVIRAKGIVAMLVDQKMNDGIEAPFFGIPAMSPPAAALLHLRYGVALIPAWTERLPQCRFHVHAAAPITIEPTGDQAADVLALVTRINAFLEERIRARPQDWLWLHNRWPAEG